MRRPSLVVLVLALPCLVACSSGSGSGTGGDGGATIEVDGGGDGGGGGGGVTINECKTFLDETGPTGARKIDWNLSVATSPTRCMTIKKGQTIAFEGDLKAHPLLASGGDTPTPFASVADTGKVTFPAAGTFGFVCGVHPSMTGAIKVIE